MGGKKGLPSIMVCRDCFDLTNGTTTVKTLKARVAQLEKALEITEAVCRAAQEENKALRAQLPETMQDCTIKFLECEKGHGRLTSTNWEDHGCQRCEVEALREKYDATIRGHDEFVRVNGIESWRRLYARVEAENKALREMIKGPLRCMELNELEETGGWGWMFCNDPFKPLEDEVFDTPDAAIDAAVMAVREETKP
jgi:hypothetical protein